MVQRDVMEGGDGCFGAIVVIVAEEVDAVGGCEGAAGFVGGVVGWFGVHFHRG